MRANIGSTTQIIDIIQDPRNPDLLHVKTAEDTYLALTALMRQDKDKLQSKRVRISADASNHIIQMLVMSEKDPTSVRSVAYNKHQDFDAQGDANVKETTDILKGNYEERIANAHLKIAEDLTSDKSAQRQRSRIKNEFADHEKYHMQEREIPLIWRNEFGLKELKKIDSIGGSFPEYTFEEMEKIEWASAVIAAAELYNGKLDALYNSDFLHHLYYSYSTFGRNLSAKKFFMKERTYDKFYERVLAVMG